MQLSYAAVAAALVACASAAANTTASAVWVTDVVDTYVTVCPASTQLTFNGVTYTATKSQTLTITNCPCTVSKLSSVTPAAVISTKAPVYVNSTVVPAASTPVTKTTAVGTTSAKTGAATFTGAANRAVAGSAAGLAGLLGLAAYIL